MCFTVCNSFQQGGCHTHPTFVDARHGCRLRRVRRRGCRASDGGRGHGCGASCRQVPLDWLGACVSVRRRPSRAVGTRACMFASIEDVIERFGKLQYIASRTIGTVVYLASHLKKPILVEGPAGVGKTELAKVVAQALGHDLIRLQCYEGLDEAKALYEWEYAKQLLYTQILKDKISEVLGSARSLSEAVDKIASEDDVVLSDRCSLPRT